MLSGGLAMHQLTKSLLSPKRQLLVELMQNINFGHIANLPVISGEPHLTPTTLIEREIKFSAVNTPRTERSIKDFHLKQEVLLFIDALSRMRNGTIQKLEIKNGLPFLMRIEETAL
jgi:hypothetical protein